MSMAPEFMVIWNADVFHASRLQTVCNDIAVPKDVSKSTKVDGMNSLYNVRLVETDPSPIEHEWEIIEQKLQHHPQPALIVPVLTQQVQQAWNSIPQSDIRHLYQTVHPACRLAFRILEVTPAINMVGLHHRPLGFGLCHLELFSILPGHLFNQVQS
ncbi:uncharacterized protein TNCV_3652541 [Trichonephila clavipes]|nr:uncharacterized protein TNCV_3652541 [Trichonephila clavipes]